MRWGAVVTVSTALISSACGSAPAPAQFSDAECSSTLTLAGARCGHVRVPENYAQPGGRTIGLYVVVLPALHDDGLHDAHFEIDGGPGLAVTDTIDFYLGPGAAYREKRDLVFMDLRGTGASHPLRCPEIEALEQTDAWAPMYPPDRVAKCATQLSTIADLNQYTTRNAAKDLESIRVALAYEKVSFFAISYGTSLALTYTAEYPQHVRAAVLVGTAPPDSAPPRDHAPNAAKAMSALFAACRSDPSCRAKYPDPAVDLSQAQEQLGAERAEVFAEWLRSRMYTPEGAHTLPRLVSLAAQGDVSAVSASGGPARVFADGLYLSMTCSENFPHFDPATAGAAARATPFGDYRLRRQASACAQWPVTPSAPVVMEGIMTPAVLFVSGEYDPVTPPEWADRMMRHFPDSRHVVLPGSGHIFDGMSGIETCLDPLMLEFLNTGDAAGLDVGCIAEMRPPPFALDAVATGVPAK
jgi:pimeloyl-ACP methyl ester carboxylesterase